MKIGKAHRAHHGPIEPIGRRRRRREQMVGEACRRGEGGDRGALLVEREKVEGGGAAGWGVRRKRVGQVG